MKKSQQFRPDYQVMRDGDFGRVYRPVRALVLPCGAMVCLMHGYDDTWIVFSLDARGVPAHSRIYSMKSVSEVMWRELCHELTEDAKKHLVASTLDTAPSPERTDMVLELARLELADDEKCEGIAAKSEEFVRTHSEAEVQEYIRQKTAEYDEAELKQYAAMRASNGEAE